MTIMLPLPLHMKWPYFYRLSKSLVIGWAFILEINGNSEKIEGNVGGEKGYSQANALLNSHLTHKATLTKARQ